jgi:WD40 repeat protein
MMWDTITKKLLQTLDTMGKFCIVAFSPDGKHLAVPVGQTIVVWEWDSNRIRLRNGKEVDHPRLKCLDYEDARKEWRYFFLSSGMVSEGNMKVAGFAINEEDGENWI